MIQSMRFSSENLCLVCTARPNALLPDPMWNTMVGSRKFHLLLKQQHRPKGLPRDGVAHFVLIFISTDGQVRNKNPQYRLIGIKPVFAHIILYGVTILLAWMKF